LRDLHSFPTRRSSDLSAADAHRLSDPRLLAPALLAYAHYLEDAMRCDEALDVLWTLVQVGGARLSSPDAVAAHGARAPQAEPVRSEEHTSELQSRFDL